ncbi:MAG: pectate lyase [Ferruginibacter sp.]|nr:pectate lyase [Ferruginibacter sp.]
MINTTSFIAIKKLRALVLFGCTFVCCLIVNTALSQKKAPATLSPIAYKNGKLVYSPDSAGNRIPDFSFCGYKASEQAIPNIAVKVVVPTAKGDATLRIQSALDYVAGLPINSDGFRGAVLLQRGEYEVFGQLRISAPGVVLRGSGMNKGGTTLIGAGTGRLALVKITGQNDRVVSSEIKITDEYVPVNAIQFSIENASEFKAGDKIIVHRPSTREWIETIGTANFGGGISSLGWKPGDRDIFFDRTITSIHGSVITIDAPITTALDAKYGGGSVAKYRWDGRISNAGIENMHCISTWDKNNPKDEDHRWNAINIENAEDAWVRQMTFENFAGSAVSVLETSKRVTVEDCNSLNPVSEIGGQRRYTFLTTGQQTLFQRCYAEYGYHDFATGYCAPGPNAFVQCESHLPYNFSGAIDSWASGILFDVVNADGNALRFGNRGMDGNGAGWAAANSLFWNCTAARIDCYQPPMAQNWSFGSWSQFAGDGYWTESNNSINPRSLFYAQLAERLNKNVDKQSQILFHPGEASSSPSVEVAAELIKQSVKPRMQLKEWISSSFQRNPVSLGTANTKTIDEIGIKKIGAPTIAPVMQIKNGLLIRGNEILTGKRQSVPWWTGGIQGQDLQKALPAITRFVPGRSGNGLTDDLNELTEAMKAKNIIGMEQNYGLWYDRRRDDHERIRRMDGEVWPPFYELPFARSGKETAWDGLSKYDLTKYNLFYWSRLKQFADLADQKGLLLVNQNYFQHNIIEAGAHYADFPWRTANNINHTSFPEPPPYAGDKRIFMAEQFYDVTDPVRRQLHIKYIRQSLNNFKDNNGVIQLIGEEFTGPLHFVKFWLSVIRDWEKETGKKQIIGLSVTKDVQDSILNNPAYASVVDLIDIRYWHYQADGIAYEPKGGLNLAPRQHARLLKPKKTSFEQVYRAVKEYRLKYPSKAVVYSGDSYPEFGWAVFMAGGSLPVLPANIDKTFLKAASNMEPVNNMGDYVLENASGIIKFAGNETNIEVDLGKMKGNYKVKFVSIKDGMVTDNGVVVEGGKKISVDIPKETGILWLEHLY